MFQLTLPTIILSITYYSEFGNENFKGFPSKGYGFHKLFSSKNEK